MDLPEDVGEGCRVFLNVFIAFALLRRCTALLVPQSGVAGSVTAEGNVEDNLHVVKPVLDVAFILLEGEVWFAPGSLRWDGFASSNVVGLRAAPPAPHLDVFIGPLGSVCRMLVSEFGSPIERGQVIRKHAGEHHLHVPPFALPH